MLGKIEIHLSLATGKQRLVYAFLLGVHAVAGLAPLYWWPLFLISFAGLLVLLENPKSKKQLFWTGWSYGFGYFTFGLYWISFALHIDLAKWWWLIPFAAIGLPLVLSVYYGIAALCAWPERGHRGRTILALVIGFSLIEYLRGYLFTGFPWNLPAYIWLDTALAMQMSLIGAYGLTFISFGLAAILRLTLIRQSSAIIFIVLLGALWGGGYFIQIDNMTQMQKTPTDTQVLLVQPNIPQIDKWNRDKFNDNFEKLIRLSSGYSENNKPDIIIWPETALTWPIQYLDEIKPRLNEIIAPEQILISGILDYGENDFFNSLIVLDDQAQIIEQYNKFHLVPFGEYIPFRNYISMGPIASALETTGDFSTGKGLSTLQGINELSFSPLICYEIIFPGKVYNTESRPNFIINVTNDGWYLNSAGPYQHLSISRARAIESGLPVIRVANTGISAVIDPNGRILTRIALSEEGATLAPLPSRVKATFYGRYKDLAFFSIAVILGFFLLATKLKRKQQGFN
jgi:apolipoprotein N-acyltransferase